MTADLYLKDTSEVFDALVIGSGVTGGWAAKEFCERGLKTLMIERGRVVEHRKDYPGENVPPWKQEFRGRVPLKVASETQPVQSKCYAYNESTKHFFGNDRDLPYTTAEGTDFRWYRGNQLGGKSLTWGRQSYRLSDFDFQANAGIVLSLSTQRPESFCSLRRPVISSGFDLDLRA